MKLQKIFLYALTGLLVWGAISCSGSASDSRKVIYVKEADIVKKEIPVIGMTCVGCEVTLEENVSKINGVVSVKASHTKKKATIEYDSTKTDLQTISKAIQEAGYKIIGQ